MGNEELKARLTELLPAAVFEETADTSPSAWINVNIEPAGWPSSAIKLRDDDSLLFNYLFCLTCIDWKTHLTMVYHLTSTRFRHHIVVKAKLDAAKPEIGSVAGIWKTANFHEREVYELFGINFIDHPDLRLLILPDGWEGKNPLRKNFEDPVNMIRL